MVHDTVLQAVGNTPLIALRSFDEPGSARILGKFEAVNIGGSIKTRTALKMIEGAEARGEIGPDTIVVEPTSGNQGIGLALVCAVKGYRCCIIMPDSVSEERRKIVRHYGAEVIIEHDNGDIGECIERCIQRAEAMAETDPNVFVPQQFENTDNLLAHEDHTAQEILNDIDGPIDGFCCGFGTGGTITGVAGILKEANPHLQVWCAEPEDAALLSGGNIGTHIQMGIGDGIIPKIMDVSIIDELVTISDDEALVCAKQLAREDGLLAGISSGTNVACARRLARKLGEGKTVVTILPDTGERYFSTALFDGA